MKERKLVIIGAGDLAREVLYAALDDKSAAEGLAWRPTAFVVDAEFKTTDTLENVPVVTFDEVINVIDAETYCILSVTHPASRKAMHGKLTARVPDVKFGQVIHRSAIIMPTTVVEEGVYIAANTTIAIGCRIKKHAVINQNISIGHDCVIGEHAILSPGCVLSGRTTIGNGSFLGSVVVTFPKVQIGDDCMVSAGVVVSRNLMSGNKQIPKPTTMILPIAP